MRRTILLLSLMIALTAVLAFTLGQRDSNKAEAGVVKPEMSLSAHGPDVTCDGAPSTSKGAVPKPVKCDVPVGGQFTLSIDVNGAPALGYVLAQTWINYGANLTYKKAPFASDEFVWPDSDPSSVIRKQHPGSVAHASLTGLIPPLPVSNFLGNIVELVFNCPAKSNNVIDLIESGDPIAGTSGAAFVEDVTFATIIPNVDSLGINCVNPKPEMSLSAHGPDVTCDGQPSTSKGAVPKPLKCDVPVGGQFTLSIDVNAAPALGYTGFQTWINYGANLTYKKAPLASDEIVWPDNFPAVSIRSQGLGSVYHGGLTGLIPPLPASNFLGNIVELVFNCPAKSDSVIDLIELGHPKAGASGSAFFEFGTGLNIVPNVDSLGINCVNPQDGQININVVNADNQTQKLADTCWLISVNHFDIGAGEFINKPFAVISDNNAKPACDIPIKGFLADKDPAVGSIAITIPAAEMEFWDSTEWHFQQIQAPDNYNLDPTEWVCTLSGLFKKSPPNEDLIACDEADPFVIKNVAKAPPKDAFLNPTVVGGLPYSDAVVTKAATLELNDPVISCKSSYGHSVWYQYTPTADQIVTVDTFGSDYDTVLAAFSGPKGALNEIACNDDEPVCCLSQVFVNLTAGTTYHFLVGSWTSGPGGKLVFNMEAKASPPSSCNEGNNNDFELGVVDFNEIFCWTVVSQPGSFVPGSWCTQAGVAKPTGPCFSSIGAPVPAPPQGTQAAMASQDGPGSHVLYRCNVLAAGSVSFQLYLNNFAGAYSSPATLDFTAFPNQQFRADLVTKAGIEADPFTVAAGDILLNIYQTDPGDPLVSGYTPVAADISAFVGQNVCLRFSAVMSEFHFNVGIDDVQFELKKKKPGDTDGDGCPDVHENRPKSQASQGGGRDYLDPNDYYDVYGPGQSLVRDGVIDLPNDILGVIQHFAPSGAPPYDVRFDRGPQIGANVWNMGPPDGVIDLPNDILGVIKQYQHNCV